MKSGWVVVCSHVSRSFQIDRTTAIDVLKDVNLKVKGGEMVSIVGPSGSGKTTLLNIIGCLSKPTRGEVLIGGISISGLSDDELSDIRRLKIGTIFQDFYVLEAMTSLQNIEIPMILNHISTAQRRKRADELLSIVGLYDRRHHKPSNLSHGEKQRVAIARALANDPPILLADEPTGNLDVKTGEKIVRLLLDLTDDLEKAVLMVTHDLDAARKSDRVLRLEGGVLAPVKR